MDEASRSDALPLGVVDDDRLRLLFMCCHPALAPDVRVALTLRLVAGLTMPEIGRALLTPERTVAQRLTRAKRKIAATNLPFTIPAAARPARPRGRRADRRLPAVQRGPPRLDRPGARRPGRRGGPAGAAAGRAGARRPGVAGAAGADAADPGAAAGAGRRGVDRAAGRPGPVAVGPGAHRRGARDRAAAAGAQRARTAADPGRDQRRPHLRRDGGRDRLAPGRRALRPADGDRAVAGGGDEPGGRAGRGSPGRRPGCSSSTCSRWPATTPGGWPAGTCSRSSVAARRPRPSCGRRWR